jgi:hypothetical protein
MTLEEIESIITYEDLLLQMEISDENLFIHGPAGYGKSHLIKEYKKKLKSTLFAAPSGIAALNIQGITLHSLFCLKPVSPQPGYYENNLNENRITLLKKAVTLLIDEISMVSADLLDKIDIILRTVRKNESPFGDMRIIMVGDIFQLQSFQNNDTSLKLLKKLYPDKDSFQFYNSNVFNNPEFLENLKVYHLSHDFRHENDPRFSDLLSLIRINKAETQDLEKINARVTCEKVDCLRLTTKNSIAEYINSFELRRLDDKLDVSVLKMELFDASETILPSMYPVHDELLIKIGMKIIFVMNDSETNGKRWVNGTRGTVTGKWYNNDELELVRVSIENREGKPFDVKKEWFGIYVPRYDEKESKIISSHIASVCQFPFIAAWAITIHRSQSLTLDKAMLELGADVFAAGQLYVGLSRVKRLEDLYLNRPIHKSDIKLLPETAFSLFNLKFKAVRCVVKEVDPRIEQIQNLIALMPDPAVNDTRVYNEEINEQLEAFNRALTDSALYDRDINVEDAGAEPERNTAGNAAGVNDNVLKQDYKPKRKKAPEGIDKIKLVLNPFYVNLESYRKNLNAQNSLTLHKGGPFRMLSIHAEYINPKVDIHLTIAKAVFSLINNDILDLSFLKDGDRRKALYFIYTHLDYFVILVSEIEFYFNIKSENMRIKDEAVIYGYLIPVSGIKNPGAVSYYTRDYRKKGIKHSYGIIYDRYAKLKKDNQTAREVLSKMTYKKRLEIKLFNTKSDWMDIRNLKGSYTQIMNRYFDYLSIIYKEYFYGYVNVNSSENKNLDKIIRLASVTGRKRFTNPDGKLKKQKPIPYEKTFLMSISGNEKTQKYNELKNEYDAFSIGENDGKYLRFERYISFFDDF